MGTMGNSSKADKDAALKEARLKKAREAREAASAYLRAENEDDDGYDPYSDRPATPEPLFERDPWS